MEEVGRVEDDINLFLFFFFVFFLLLFRIQVLSPNQREGEPGGAVEGPG